MPFGAHETMELHEILMEKVNMITHFNLYAQQARNPQLLDMLIRHQQEEILAYNELVGLARGNTRFTPIPPNTDVRVASNQQIRYGLNNPQQVTPQADAVLSDKEIAIAMLLCHKNAARNSTWATLECADPNMRRALLNSAATCTHQAYEVFLFMNEQGAYQVPTLNDQTSQTVLQSYQPASSFLEQQYGVQSVQNGSYSGQSSYGSGYMPTNMAGGVGKSASGSMNPGSRESVLYGDGVAGQYRSGSNSTYSNMGNQGQMQH